MIIRFFLLSIILIIQVTVAFGCDDTCLITGLEESGYTKLTSTTEISVFVDRLAKCFPSMNRKEVIGKTVEGLPIDALIISKEAEQRETEEQMTVMLVGGQHGTEPSGPEALLIVARDFMKGDLQYLLEHLKVIIIPNVNPSGRLNRKRVNKNGVNLSTDFVALTQPETKALNNALIKLKPEVFLDVHESAILKKKSLGKEGFLTDFEAQFEVANNPNVAEEIRTLSLKKLLPEIISQVNKQGLPARRYIGEITSTTQPITNGGLSIRNVRNKAGLYGIFAFLVENRLDPSGKDYPTFRNIKVRVEKQVLSIKTFLKVMDAHRKEIVRASHDVRKSIKKGKHMELSWAYVLDRKKPLVVLPLRKRDTGQLVQITYANHRTVKAWNTIKLPSAYVITDNMSIIKPVLDRNAIAYKVIDSPLLVKAQPLEKTNFLAGNKKTIQETDKASYLALTQTPEVELNVKVGSLWIELNQFAGSLVPLLLEPSSSSSIFRGIPFSELVNPEKEFFIYRISTF